MRRVIRTLRGQDVAFYRQIRLSMVRLGSDYGGWFVVPEFVTSDSIIYSFGVGEDITFDLAVIQRFGCQVEAFDPTPRSINWLQQQALPTQFCFHDFGIASHDGTASFHAAPKQHWVSRSIHQSAPNNDTIAVPVKRLSTIMTLLGHHQIDLLKMDVEGAEYQVIDDMLNSRIRPKQLLVEFHHRFNYIDVAETRKAIDALNQAGYRIFAVSDTGEEYGFIR